MPETPAPYDTTGEPASARTSAVGALFALYERLTHQLSAAHAPDLLEIQLTMSQAKLMYVVLVAGSIRMSVLAARLGVALSTISGVVDRLVDLGLVDRHDDPADRRQVLVTVTDKGAAELDRLRELNVAELQTLLRYVDDADLPALVRAVEILVAAAARAVPTDSPSLPTNLPPGAASAPEGVAS